MQDGILAAAAPAAAALERHDDTAELLLWAEPKEAAGGTPLHNMPGENLQEEEKPSKKKKSWF